MPAPLSSVLSRSLAEDCERLANTAIPIVTVTGTFQEDLKAWHGLPHDNSTPDHIFSRAHFSMAYAIANTIWGKTIDPKKAWLVDPTNYVDPSHWNTILLTEVIGRVLARTPLLKRLKDGIDQHGRNKLPILESITPPLLHLFEQTHHPILSLHIAAGNLLAEIGKPVVQVVTDPHIREEYLKNLHLNNFTLCVFDNATKLEALEKAARSGKTVNPDQIIVTGPPIDYRIVAAGKTKKPPHIRPVRILICTGGLGTNKNEIRAIIDQLLPTLRAQKKTCEVMVYCGTQKDIYDMVQNEASEHRIKITDLAHSNRPQSTLHNPLSILYHPQIFDANELLIRHGFPWADVIITKPSGDMAYDAAASGAAILTLSSWGVWEDRIAEIFRQKNIARPADIHHIVQQLSVLTSHTIAPRSWLETAMTTAKTLDPLFVHGTKNIIKVMRDKT